MARQYLIPGGHYINETGNNEYLLPGGGYINENQEAQGSITSDGVNSVIVDLVYVATIDGVG